MKLAAIALLFALTPNTLRTTAHDFYEWLDREYPVATSDNGKHTWDHRLPDYSAAARAKRSAHVKEVLARVRATDVSHWSKDDVIDWLLFRSNLEGAELYDRVVRYEENNPTVYVDEASNAIFSLLKKDYDSPRNRALSATKRLQKVPRLIAQAKQNVQHPVQLYAKFAIESARAVDPLYNDSLMTLAKDLSPAEREALVKAKDGALEALHGSADSLEKRLDTMPSWKPMGEADYNYMLRHIHLLPINAHDVAHLGEAEVGRHRDVASL